MIYNPAKYKDDEKVKIINRSSLEKFHATWKLHNPLKPEQLAFADKTARVAKSYMYHGGDVLYELKDIPGVWHEQCLIAT